jgi:catechol 2,3-dioxygenase-like lactoylglutathione lyase family enzyme
MPISTLDHWSVRTTDLEATRKFYVDVLGLRDGDRPDFPFPGNWFYVGDKPIVHVIGIDPDGDNRGLKDYMGEEHIVTETGPGAVDHIAFNADNADALMDHLKKKNVPFRHRQVPGMDLFQLFVDDPNGVCVELNYWGDKR